VSRYWVHCRVPILDPNTGSIAGIWSDQISVVDNRCIPIAGLMRENVTNDRQDNFLELRKQETSVGCWNWMNASGKLLELCLMR
jgi:hypothetical protein